METTNSAKYYFSDFCHKEYRELLSAAKKNYNFKTYDQINNSDNEKYILWRHDVDFSVEEAYNLAKIEIEAGVVSTYFILPHCEYYSIFENETCNLIKEIIAMGHHLGLHFDSEYYNIRAEDQLEGCLKKESELLVNLFDYKSQVFSFHNPNEFCLSCLDWEYGGMINTYAAYFKNEVGYCSDSNGYWRHRRLKEVLFEASENKLQILTHPEWWSESVSSPRKKIEDCINKRAKKNLDMYHRMLAECNRENIDW